MINKPKRSMADTLKLLTSSYPDGMAYRGRDISAVAAHTYAYDLARANGYDIKHAVAMAERYVSTLNL
jgi:hypothetical protein